MDERRDDSNRSKLGETIQVFYEAAATLSFTKWQQEDRQTLKQLIMQGTVSNFLEWKSLCSSTWHISHKCSHCDSAGHANLHQEGCKDEYGEYKTLTTTVN